MELEFPPQNLIATEETVETTKDRLHYYRVVLRDDQIDRIATAVVNLLEQRASARSANTTRPPRPDALLRPDGRQRNFPLGAGEGLAKEADYDEDACALFNKLHGE